MRQGNRYDCDCNKGKSEIENLDQGNAPRGDLISSAKEILRSLKTGDTSKLIIRRVEVADPSKYSPRDVKALREKLKTSQSLFARLMGVSTDLVAHWEHGIRKPAPMACRLMDRIQKDPEGFLTSLVEYRTTTRE